MKLKADPKPSIQKVKIPYGLKETMEETLEGARLHTAEHMFARALQDQGMDIHVRKADTYNEEDVGKAYIREIIPLDKIKNAEIAVNEKILQNMKVREESFDTLEEAMASNPKLRFNEERLEGKTNIRVVVIGDYDFSACKHMHVKNTNEIIAFAVKRVSYLGGETEIEFLAGGNAVEFMINMKNVLLEAAMKNHFLTEELNVYLDKQRESINELEREGKEMLSYLIRTSKEVIELKGVKLSRFYSEISNMVKMEPKRCIALTNGLQLTVLKGKDSEINLAELGEKLRKKGFSGSVNETMINGKADETIISELKNEWKA